jgi:hypothetical protein
MSWNYRVVMTVEDGEKTYAIHEVFYDEKGVPEGWSADPCKPFGESPQELRDDLMHMWRAFDKPVLTEAHTPRLVEVEDE